MTVKINGGWADTDEYGFAPGETLSAHCARLDGELFTARAEVGVCDEPLGRDERLTEGHVLDSRLPGLFLDALTPVEAAIASAATRLPYVAMRSVVSLDEDRRGEILNATQAVVAKHPDFFAEHRSEIEFFVSLTAVTAAQVDHLVTLVDTEQAGSKQLAKPCSAVEALAIALFVFAPLALFALILVLKRREK